MAFGDPITGGEMVQATIMYGLGKAGWSETYFMNINGSSNTLASAENSMARIILLRKPVLPGDVVAESLRLSLVTKRGDSNLLFPPDANLGVGAAVLQSAHPNLGWNCVVENEDFWVGDTRIYKGWIPAMIPYNGVGVIGVEPPIPVKAWSLAMYEILRNPYSSLGGTVRYCLKSHIRPGFSVVYPQMDVVSFSLDVSGRLVVTVLTAGIGGMVIRDILMVHAERKRCVKGVSGRWKILDMTAAGVNTQITLANRPCCASADLLDGMTGTAQVYKEAYYPVRWFTLGRQGTRKTGRAFFVPAGRQSAKCC